MVMSSTIESTAARLSRHLECPVCLDIYDKPKALPCQHTFCLSCIQRTAKGNTIQCPSCKIFHRLPNGKVDDFPNNYTLIPMIEEMQQIRLHEDIHDQHDEAAEDFIDKQLQQDTLKDLESHADTLDLIVNRLQALQETISSKSSQVKSTISTDIGQLIRCLQEREQELLDDVALQFHTENSRLQILKGEVAAEARNLRELCNKQKPAVSGGRQVTTKEWGAIVRQGDQHLQRISQTCKRYEQVEYNTTEFYADSEQRKQAIDGLRHYGHLTVRQQVQHVLLQRTRLYSLPVLSDLHKPDPQHLSPHRSHAYSVDEYNQSGSASYFPKRGRSLNSQVPSSYAPTTATSYPDPSTHGKDDGINVTESMGKISNLSSWKRPLMEHRKHQRELTKRSTVRNCRSICESTKIIEGYEYDPLYPLGMTVLSSGKIAVASGSTLRIFNTEGVESTPRAPLKTKKARVLADACCLPDDTILATDSFNNEVLQFSSNGRLRGTFRVQELGKKLEKTIKPYGINCDRQGFLYICDRGNNGVVVCRPNGVVDRVIGVTGINRLTDPLYLALHKNETVLYVTDCKAAVVMVFTTEGDFIRRIPNKVHQTDTDVTCAQFSRPAGISVALDGSLVVCDSDQNVVHILDQSTGEIMALIGTSASESQENELDTDSGAGPRVGSALERPMGVICIEAGCIAVCDTGNNRIQIYNAKM